MWYAYCKPDSIDGCSSPLTNWVTGLLAKAGDGLDNDHWPSGSSLVVRTEECNSNAVVTIDVTNTY